MTVSGGTFGALALVVLLGLLARRRRIELAEPGVRAGRALALAVALTTGVVTIWVNGGLSRPALIHDEAAYLLQAQIFAAGRWSSPPPPLPEFFEQYHVLVSPRLAPKYFPGHALLLTPGLALGLPGLVPTLLAAVTGGLLFGLGRALAGTWVALLGWAIWLTAPGAVLLRWSYLSQLTTTPAWLGACWLLWRWWQDGRPRDAAGVGALLGLLAITRPWTALALGLPIGIVLLFGVFRRRDLKAPFAASVAALALVGIVPLWSAAATSSFGVTPYERYRDLYIPWDRLGFGLDPRPPERELPPDMIAFGHAGAAMHERHRLDELPAIAATRLVTIASDLCGSRGWRVALLPFLVVGLAALPPPARWGLACCALLVGLHLVYAHAPGWGFYYQEIAGFLAFAAALGVRRVVQALSGSDAPRSAAASALLIPVILAASLPALAAWRRDLEQRLEPKRRFEQELARIAERRAIVFVRYAADHSPHQALVENPPDHATARLWLVHDRGPDNERLLRAAPERAAYRFDEASGRLTPLAPGSANEVSRGDPL